MRPSRPLKGREFELPRSLSIRAREGTADGRSRSSRRRRGYSYSMTNRRPFTLRLTPNG